MATFANRVKEQRVKKGLSQPQLAEEIGLTKQTISLWERGVRRPDFETMNILAQYFGVNLAYLIGQSDDPTVHELTDEDASDWADSEGAVEIEGLASQLSRLSEDSRRIVAATIREAYRVDREAGKLVEGYLVNVTGKKPHLV